ncbi:universal stress protein [Sphingomonas sp. RT2P30]|uniref:universal stress protein n=1 Tax=Parasphingomonas halimpatiens TaxID=3096162 RepID=UPI002FCC62AA
MKNVLLLCHEDSGQEARFQVALDLARALEGHLTCLDVVVPPVAMANDYVGISVVAEMTADAIALERDNRTRLTARLSRDDVPWDWIDATGDLAACIGDVAALADVIVVSRRLDDFPLPDMRGIAGELIVASGKPVLAVPPDAQRFVFGRALVAWDGSPAAAAALHAAVPLLQLADQVTVLEVDDGSIAAPAEEAASYLARHDVHPEILRLKPGPSGASAAIATQVASGSFDYLVMGGFSHQRFVEALFGGVTRTMLGDCPIPVLMAH